MAFIGVAFIWCGVGVLLCLFCWHIVAFCFSLDVALRHRPGAELQVSGLFLQFMCAILAIYSCNLVLLRVVVGAEFFSVFSSPFYAPFFLNCSQLFFGVFLESLSVFFFGFGGLFVVVLHHCPIHVCWLVRPCFRVSQYAHCATHIEQPFKGPFSGSFHVGSSIFWGFRGRLHSCFGNIEFSSQRDCGRCGPSALTVLANLRRNVSCRESRRPVFWCDPSPSLQRCFQLSHGCC